MTVPSMLKITRTPRWILDVGIANRIGAIKTGTATIQKDGQV
jgi:hypothetical protein